MNKKLIRDLAITGGIYDCLCDPYDKHETGDYYGSVMDDLERFAEKIIQDCVQVCRSQRDPANLNYKPSERFAQAVKEHFGVEE